MTLSAKERRGARAAESDGLENRCPERDRGFESHPLRQTARNGAGFSPAQATYPTSRPTSGAPLEKVEAR